MTDPGSRLVEWTFGRRHIQLGRFPLLMGIVNVTPDSFSDGGNYAGADAALQRALELIEEGADLLDIGGESTRPGATPVSADEELNRVVPVVERVAAETDTPISIDTTKSAVAQAALAAGAAIVNDVSGLTADPEMVSVCRDFEAGVVCMHMQGTPQTMQNDPQYADVVEEVHDYLGQRLSDLESAGIPTERVVIDPGIGFGKTAEHNLEILSHVGRFRALGRPVLIGHSRKRFLKKVLGRPVDDRTWGTVGVAVALAMQSVDILRVHDVAAVRDTLLAWKAVADRLELRPF